MTMEIRFKKLSSEAVTPFKKYDVDAGFDMTAIWIKETDNYTEYGTGIVLEIPDGYVGLMFPRSSIRDQNLMLKNSVGVIDASYRGEIKFSFLSTYHNVMDKPFTEMTKENQYEVGDRIGQIVFVKIPDVVMVESTELNETNRGIAGYGSSGK